ncbi:class I SAM-dependent methyltransferase [Candidatus Kaiserbacteria bacterium]|nr:class I SAM-dependent methyltransferase [Candidatus Kaiserbacteria bacterium]
MSREEFTIASYERDPVWKDKADAIISPEVIRNIWSLLVSSSNTVPSPEKDFIFVSPTANTATHEEIIFNEDAKTRHGHGLFFIGDKARLTIPENRKKIKIRNNDLRYFRWDAKQLPFQVDDTEKNTHGQVDMIWDRKGLLWFSASDGSARGFLQDLKRFHSILKPGGCVVIDDIEGYYETVSKVPKQLIPKIIAHVNPFKRKRPEELATQHESSTVQQINNLKQHDYSPVWPEIDKDFERISIGTGTSKVLILRKR